MASLPKLFNYFGSVPGYLNRCCDNIVVFHYQQIVVRSIFHTRMHVMRLVAYLMNSGNRFNCVTVTIILRAHDNIENITRQYRLLWPDFALVLRRNQSTISIIAINRRVLCDGDGPMVAARHHQVWATLHIGALR